MLKASRQIEPNHKIDIQYFWKNALQFHKWGGYHSCIGMCIESWLIAYERLNYKSNLAL